MEGIHLSEETKQALENFSLPEEVGFGTTIAPVMIECDYQNEHWSNLSVKPFAPISICPTAKVFHYGQEIFEGLKAYKSPSGDALLFRPKENANRFNHSARRTAMPEVPTELFIQSCELMTDLCRDFIPSASGSSLYLRPFMFATETSLGIKPSDSFKFMVLASPSGSYFKTGGVNVYIERNAVRACPGGVGTAKTGGNYAASLLSSKEAFKRNCQQTLWLDALHHELIEEMSGMNFMFIENNTIVTPTLTDTILAGITRKSVLELGKSKGMKVEERPVKINDLLEKIKTGDVSEAFACGTAAIITPIEKLMEADGTEYPLKNTEEKISLKLRQDLLNIQEGKESGPQGWSVTVKKHHL